MSEIVVNIDGINKVASNINKRNNDIQSEYSKVKSKISNLKNGWAGQACNNALNVISEINKQSSIRNHDLEERSDFLTKIVIPNIKNTTNENMKLKKRFDV